MTTHINHWILILGAAAALASACGGMEADEVGADEVTDESAIFGSDACKNADFHITNSFEDGTLQRRIKVNNIELHSVSEGRWINENVPNTEIAYGATGAILNEDLQYLENDLIDQVRPHFNFRESDGQWSLETSQTINITDVTCRADQQFSFTID